MTAVAAKTLGAPGDAGYQITGKGDVVFGDGDVKVHRGKHQVYRVTLREQTSPATYWEPAATRSRIILKTADLAEALNAAYGAFNDGWEEHEEDPDAADLDEILFR